MNIQSSMRRQPTSALAKPEQNQGQEPKQPPQENGPTFADSVVGTARYGGAAMGVIAGFRTAIPATIAIATALEVSNATGIFIGALAAGTIGGGFIGYHLPELAAKGGGFLAEKVGASQATGRAIGAAVTGSAAAGLLTGSPVGALVGAGVIGAGGLIGSAG